MSVLFKIKTLSQDLRQIRMTTYLQLYYCQTLIKALAYRQQWLIALLTDNNEVPMSHREGRIIHDADSHIIEARGGFKATRLSTLKITWRRVRLI